MRRFLLDLDATEMSPRSISRAGSGKRRRTAASATSSAAELIGVIEPGVEICGLTMGQFSLIDILEHCLDCAGPARVAISTWTMGIYDNERAAQFFASGLIRSIRWVVDPSIFGRRPELAGSLVQRYGADSFRAVNTHAKFATVVGDDLAVAIRSSMNLNPNRRLEHFDLSESPELCRFYDQFVDEAFAAVEPGSTSQSRAWFAGLLDGMAGDGRSPLDDTLERSLATALAAA